MGCRHVVDHAGAIEPGTQFLTELREGGGLVLERLGIDGGETRGQRVVVRMFGNHLSRLSRSAARTVNVRDCARLTEMSDGTRGPAAGNHVTAG